jgi:ribosomal-protein-alanine N-acetyltransferase
MARSCSADDDGPSPAFDACSRRLVLRPVELEDAVETANLMTKKLSDQLTRWPGPMSVADARERIATAHRDRARGQALDLAILLRDRGRLAGWIGMGRPAGAEQASIGYWLGEPFQGEGLMREAVAAALPLFARFFGSVSVRTAVRPDNIASIAILAGIGLVPTAEGELFSPVRGSHDHVIWYEGRLPFPQGR